MSKPQHFLSRMQDLKLELNFFIFGLKFHGIVGLSIPSLNTIFSWKGYFVCIGRAVECEFYETKVQCCMVGVFSPVKYTKIIYRIYVFDIHY